MDDRANSLNQDQTNRWMTALKIAIVLLFIVDPVILLIPLVK